jgi:UTP--glucose-1-phosphate uridylyltransferase
VVQQVRKAVFPVAGLGTRFLPATKASPKEMLAVVDKPLIQYAVEEAYAAGIREMVFVTGRNKRSIEDHFDVAYELESELESAGKTELRKLLDKITPEDMQCVYIRQSRALGLGHAVLCAESIVGDEPFAILLADELTVSAQPVLNQMIEVYARKQSSVVGLKTVMREQTRNYGIVSGPLQEERLTLISDLVEKPSPEAAPSNLAIAGRYVLSPKIFQFLRAQTAGVGGEIQLTDSLVELAQREPMFGLEYEGVTYDCGSKLGFLMASVDIGASHPETGEPFEAWLSSRLNRNR